MLRAPAYSSITCTAYVFVKMPHPAAQPMHHLFPYLTWQNLSYFMFLYDGMLIALHEQMYACSRFCLTCDALLPPVFCQTLGSHAGHDSDEIDDSAA
jgi:hypothetical protein